MSRRFIKIMLIIVAVCMVTGCLYALTRYQANRNHPDTVFKDALQASLSSTKLQAVKTSGGATSKVAYDLTTPTNPIISSDATLKINGSKYDIAGYGTAKNTYISYRSLPKSVSPALSSVVKDAWVGLRVNGALPAGVPANISGVADPRKQAYGPVVFANIDPKLRKQQVQYMIQRKVYEYNTTKVSKTVVGETKALVYTVKPNIGYLKIANQSAALSAGLSATDIQDAVNSLDELKDSSMKLYISTSNRQLIRADITKGGQTSTTTYNYDTSASLPDEPQTKLSWANFATYQFQIQSQAAAKQPAAQLDKDRKAQLDSLHKYLKQYFQENEFYPTSANINDLAWVAGNLNGLDPDTLRDPLASSLTLLAAPKPGVFAYQPVSAAGKGVCDNLEANQCVHYKLMATLSNNQQYVVQDP